MDASFEMRNLLLRETETFYGVEIAGRLGRYDLRVEKDKISALSPSKVSDGGYVIPLLADIHVHLDKTKIVDRVGKRASGLFEAIDLTEADKASWTDEDIRARATWAMETAFSHGVGALRSHVDCMGAELPRAWYVLNELIQDWQGRIALELCALIPVDVLRDAGESFVQQIKRDKGILGAFVYCNDDLEDKLQYCFEMAAKYDLPLDFHVDEGLDEAADGISTVIKNTRRFNMKGRVVVGHVCSLAIRTERELNERIEGLVDTDIAVTVLPTTNLYLQDSMPGRTPRFRGLAPIKELAARGVNVMLGNDNCRDPFYPFGDYDPMHILRVAAMSCQIDPVDWLSSISSTVYKRMELNVPKIEVGEKADFIWHNAQSFTELLSRPNATKHVFRAGKLQELDLKKGYSRG